MKWALERVTTPTDLPVTVTEMKRQLGETNAVTARDTDIEGLILSAVEWAEDFTGRALFDQQWRLTIAPYLGSGTVPAGTYSGDYRPSATGEILLRRSPILSIVSVSTFDAAGAETEEDAALFEVRGAATKWPTLYPLTGASWGSGEMRIVFRAGYVDLDTSPAGDSEDIPARFKQAIKLHVQAHYDRHAESMKLLLDAATALIRPERCDLGIA